MTAILVSLYFFLYKEVVEYKALLQEFNDVNTPLITSLVLRTYVWWVVLPISTFVLTIYIAYKDMKIVHFVFISSLLFVFSALIFIALVYSMYAPIFSLES